VILLDRRIGSSDLYTPLRTFGLDVELTTLESADVAWLGRGPDEVPVPVGVEIKRIGDLLQSITSGRLSGHQLPNLVREYQHTWLLVEGQYRSGDEGILETRQGGVWSPHAVGRRPWTYREVEAFLTTLEVRAGVHVRRAWNRSETAALIAMLYQWWTGKAYDEHRAHQAMHSPMLDAGLLYKPSLARRVAAELPGVGINKSGAVADHFKSVRALVEATETEWMEVPGIGKGLAKKITAALTGEKA
jgi:ERCC4-type nuclease